jgi:hypothetical protein
VGTTLRFGGCFKQDPRMRQQLSFTDVPSAITLGEIIPENMFLRNKSETNNFTTNRLAAYFSHNHSNL